MWHLFTFLQVHFWQPLLYISTSVWVLHTPKAGWNSHFQHFCAKKVKKQEICSKILKKHVFFKFAPKRWSTVLFPKNSFFLEIHVFTYKKIIKVPHHKVGNFNTAKVPSDLKRKLGRVKTCGTKLVYYFQGWDAGLLLPAM